MPEVPAEVQEAATVAFANALAQATGDGNVSYIAIAREAAVTVAYEAGVDSLPWHYGVRDSAGKVHRFREDLVAALAYAQPVDEYPQLAVLRWRQGPFEEAAMPVEVPHAA